MIVALSIHQPVLCLSGQMKQAGLTIRHSATLHLFRRSIPETVQYAIALEDSSAIHTNDVSM